MCTPGTRKEGIEQGLGTDGTWVPTTSGEQNVPHGCKSLWVFKVAKATNLAASRDVYFSSKGDKYFSTAVTGADIVQGSGRPGISGLPVTSFV